MRIGICGIKQSDTTDLIEGFRKIWPSYKIDAGALVLFDEMTAEVQYKQLNERIDKAMLYNKTKNVLHLNTSLDSLANIFWGAAKEIEGFDDHMIQKGIHLTRQSMTFYDVLFYLPITDKTYTEEKGLELDNFYNVILESYATGKKWIFPFDDVNGTPPMIEIFGNVEEKLEMIKLYVNIDGESYSSKDSLINEAIS